MLFITFSVSKTIFQDCFSETPRYFQSEQILVDTPSVVLWEEPGQEGRVSEFLY